MGVLALCIGTYLLFPQQVGRLLPFRCYVVPVSYTHLDVYKRQLQPFVHAADTKQILGGEAAQP